MQVVKEQTIASNPKASIWLSANAGTGKTHVLINRILRLILDGNDPEKIICITYTTAAATEMQNRIISYAQKWLVASNREIIEDLAAITGDDCAEENFNLNILREKLAIILDFPEKLKIQTIHSFCQSILKTFPIEAEISPFFSVMDETQKKKILESSYSETFKKIQSSDYEKQKVVNSLSFLIKRISLFSIKKTLSNLLDNKIKIEKLIDKNKNTETYLDYLKDILNISKNINPEESEKLLINNFISENLSTLTELKNKYKEASSSYQYKSELIDLFLNNKNHKDILPIFLTNSLEVRANIVNKSIFKKHPKFENISKKLQEDFLALFYKIKSIEIFNITKNYLYIFQEINKSFSKLKEEKCLLDYDDLIDKSQKLFSNQNNFLREWILYKLDGGIDHILLDEAQDTNPQQWRVIQSITEEFFSGADIENDKVRTLFIVGDEKQSIYSFQGADFHVFNKMREYFKSKFDNYDQANFQELPLSLSFRSCPAILKLVDEILSNQEVKKSVTLNYTDDSKHNAFRNEHFGYVEILPLIGEKKKINKKTRINWNLPKEYIQETEENNKILLAREIANKINNIISDKKILPSTKKPAKPKDFLILVRKRSQIFSHLINELEKLNIPVSGLDRLKLMDNLIIKDLISFAKFKLQPEDDLNLACLLKSPFFEILENTLFDFSKDRDGRSLYQVILNLSKNDKSLNKIANKLKIILSSKNNENPINFFIDILEDSEITNISNINNFTNYYGSQARDLIDEFLNLVFKFENNNLPSLQKLIDWLENNENEIKRNQESKNNEVRILTIHGSKGLQSPIVILADTTSTAPSKNNDIILENLLICTGGRENKIPLTRDFKQSNIENEEAENKRLLYVSLTRAKDELYIFGDKSDDFEKGNCWYNIIKNAASNIFEESETGSLILTNQKYFSFVNQKSLNDNRRRKGSKIETPEYLYKKTNNKTKNIRPSELFSESETTSNISKNSKKIDLISRGNFIHKLLEILPKKNKNNWNKITNLIGQTYDLNKDELIKYSNEVLSILKNPEINFIFKENYDLNEVGLISKDKNLLLYGQADKIIQTDDSTIVVIDYKTTQIEFKDAKILALKYNKQLDSYADALKKIFPKKNIKKAILFTYINSLIYI